MQQTSIEETERILASPMDIELTINDIRILIGSLDAMAYFGQLHGEEYLDEDGYILAARLKTLYEDSLSALRSPAS